MDPFRSLYEIRQSRTIATAQRIVGNRAEAEEIAQDAFLEVWQRSREAGVAPEPSWVNTTVRCRAIDRIRRRSTASFIARALAEIPASAWDRDFDRAETHADEHAVQAALLRLSPAQREAVQLVYLEGLTHQQAAAFAGVPLGTLKTRVRLAIARLARALASGTEEQAGEDDHEAHPRVVASQVEPAAVREDHAARNRQGDARAQRTRGERLEHALPLGLAQEG